LVLSLKNPVSPASRSLSEPELMLTVCPTSRALICPCFRSTRIVYAVLSLMVAAVLSIAPPHEPLVTLCTASLPAFLSRTGGPCA
jgi:hypothetical protein